MQPKKSRNSESKTARLHCGRAPTLPALALLFSLQGSGNGLAFSPRIRAWHGPAPGQIPAFAALALQFHGCHRTRASEGLEAWRDGLVRSCLKLLHGNTMCCSKARGALCVGELPGGLGGLRDHIALVLLQSSLRVRVRSATRRVWPIKLRHGRVRLDGGRAT